MLTGIIDKGALSLTDIRTEVKNITQFYEERGAIVHGYTNNSYPSVINANDYLTVTWYDDYTFPHAANYPFVSELGNSSAFDRVKGQITGAKVKTLEGSNTWLESVTYYDNRYRVIQIRTENLLGGVDRVTNRYDFTGKVMETKTTHDDKTIVRTFKYDHADRLTDTRHWAGESAKWTDLVNVEISGSSLVKTSGGNSWNGGAVSEQQILHSTDGGISFNANGTNTYRMIGFSESNANANWNTIKYAIYLQNNGTLQIRESGSGNKLASNPAYHDGDVFRIERKDGFINYWHNGSLLRSTATNDHSLVVDVSIYNQGHTLEKIYFSSTDTVLLARNEYNELGELIEKNLHSEDGTTFHQSVDYRYNIRGWLTSINNARLDGTAANNVDASQPADYWGMEFGYNTVLSGITATPAFNGNISAVKWSDNLGASQRSYAYTYDPMNRLEGADHRVLGIANAAPFDVTIGDGATSGYDLNGNIRSLTRKDKTGAGLDVLTYTYDGNRLLQVSDAGNDSKGFRDGTNPGNDYLYDDNGNMIRDLNKDITTIAYNHLDLPEKVEKDASNYILYTYDAAGMKLRQQVYEAGALAKTTDYVGEFIYETLSTGPREIALIQHEEGRIVPNAGAGNWDYQYHMRDHLGNTRLTFTTRPETLDFEATMESENAAAEETLFTNLVETRATYLNANHTAGGNEVVRLNQTQPVGAGISLPVGAGDIIGMEVYGYYEGGSGYWSTVSLASLVAAVAGAFGGVSGANGGTDAQQVIYNGFDGALGVVGGSSNDNVPAAYLNYILFDQDMISYQTGFRQMTGAANMAHELMDFSNETIKATRPGFIYVWVSNNSATNNWVYFDDMKVTLVEHPVVQSDDYYPFGLTFNSWQRALTEKNDFLYNGKEFQKDLDWNIYDYGARMYMPDIGRWNAIDPLAGLYYSATPYNYVLNQPTQAVDPDGRMCAGCEGYEDSKDQQYAKPDFDYEQKYIGSGSSSPLDDYKLDENGKVVLYETTGDKFDRLLDDNGKEIARVNKGFLSKGLNLLDEFNFFNASNPEDQRSYLSFIKKLSQFEGFPDGKGAREILGFLTNSEDGVDDLLLVPFRGNSRISATWSVGQFLIKGSYDNSSNVYVLDNVSYKLNHWFHTHPGRAGATSIGTGKPSKRDRDITRNTFKIPGFILGRLSNSTIYIDGTYKIYK